MWIQWCIFKWVKGRPLFSVGLLLTPVGLLTHVSFSQLFHVVLLFVWVVNTKQWEKRRQDCLLCMCWAGKIKDTRLRVFMISKSIILFPLTNQKRGKKKKSRQSCSHLLLFWITMSLSILTEQKINKPRNLLPSAQHTYAAAPASSQHTSRE